jgi:hypothetical protein
MARPEPAKPGADEFVLCKRSSRNTLYVCGTDPRRPGFDEDSKHARRFASVSDALAYRARLTNGNGAECAVFQLLSNGQIVPPEV